MANLLPNLPKARRLGSIAAVAEQLERLTFDVFELGLRSLITGLEGRVARAAKRTRKPA